MPGPPRTPLGILQMKGSRLPVRQGREDVAHVDGEIACPDWVGDYGQQCWEALYPLLRAVDGLMKPAYANDLALYCEAFNEMRESMDTIEDEGATCTSEKGGVYQHPAVGIKNKAIARMLKIGPRFGLNPADCTRINTEISSGSAPSDPFAEFMKGHN